MQDRKYPNGTSLSTDFEVSLKTAGRDLEFMRERWCLTDILRGRHLHPSQVVAELPGGGSHLHLRLSCLEEIEQYVLSWGACHSRRAAGAAWAVGQGGGGIGGEIRGCWHVKFEIRNL